MAEPVTDVELARLLGWEPCQFTRYSYPSDPKRWWQCDTHGYGGWEHRPDVCSPVHDRLGDVRIGIDFAKAGIADAITCHAFTGPGNARGICAELARAWQPTGSDSPDDMERLCRVMHDAYEAAASESGWMTNPQSRVPWEEVPSANKAAMWAAVRALIRELDAMSRKAGVEGWWYGKDGVADG